MEDRTEDRAFELLKKLVKNVQLSSKKILILITGIVISAFITFIRPQIVSTRELLIVFFEIERVFNIYFTEEEINDFSFASINSIIECVKKHLKNKSDVINK